MPLGSAHRLAPEATFVEADPDADRGHAEAVFEALAVFSPGLAGSTEPLDPAFGLFEVQADGLEPLWGAEPILVERLVAGLEAALPTSTHSPAPEDGPSDGTNAGAAGTRFAAMIAAVHARPGAPILVPPGGEAAFLAPRPAGLLTTDPDIRARLSRFGLRRIGAVADLPASALVARFGAEGARIHARANGEETDPFRPRRTPERLALAVPVEPPVEDLEPLRFVLHRLVGALTAQIEARGLAVTRASLRLDLELAFAPAGTPGELVAAQRFPEPTSDAEAIERLLFARLERTPPPAAVARLALELAGAEPATGQQLPLFVPQAARNARLAWQLARLALTFGEDRIRRMDLADPEAPLPERRWTWRPVDLG
jgi:protein ImuB